MRLESLLSPPVARSAVIDGPCAIRRPGCQRIRPENKASQMIVKIPTAVDALAIHRARPLFRDAVGWRPFIFCTLLTFLTCQDVASRSVPQCGSGKPREFKLNPTRIYGSLTMRGHMFHNETTSFSHVCADHASHSI